MNLGRVIKEELKKLSEISDYDKSVINKHNGRVIEIINQNGYELALVDFGGIVGKTISLTYNNKEYFKPNQQQKQPTEYGGRDFIKISKHFFGVIKEWVDKYGKLSIGSTNKQRTEYYHNWLCSKLTCGSFKEYGKLPHGESQYGFTIE